jgi:hypothetical protein
MTDREKCVAVAQDVLERLDHLRVTTNQYLGESLPRAGRQDAQKLLPQLEKDCKVCALGACFLSHIRLFNEVQMWGELDASQQRQLIASQLEKYFGRLELYLIETAFECVPLSLLQRVPNLEEDYRVSLRDALSFGWKFSKLPERLRAIMENIISNNGEFNPTTGKHRVEVSNA